MSSIWDPPDSPEEIERQARLERERRHAANRAFFAKVFGCSLVSPADAAAAANAADTEPNRDQGEDAPAEARGDDEASPRPSP